MRGEWGGEGGGGVVFFFQAEDGIRDSPVTGVQTCALPIFNDLDMIEYAGLGVAMGNAPKPVQLAANLVAPTNDADGVAHIIDTCLL